MVKQIYKGSSTYDFLSVVKSKPSITAKEIEKKGVGKNNMYTGATSYLWYAGRRGGNTGVKGLQNEGFIRQKLVTNPKRFGDKRKRANYYITSKGKKLLRDARK